MNNSSYVTTASDLLLIINEGLLKCAEHGGAIKSLVQLHHRDFRCRHYDGAARSERKKTYKSNKGGYAKGCCDTGGSEAPVT